MALIAALLTTAETEARALGDSTPGAEHLLLASLLVEDASAREVAGVTADAVRAAISVVHAESLSAIGVTQPELAASLPPARGIHRSEVSAQEDGTATRVLSQLGLERESVVDAARRVLEL